MSIMVAYIIGVLSGVLLLALASLVVIVLPRRTRKTRMEYYK